MDSSGHIDKKLLIGILISLICIVLLFRKIDFHLLLQSFSSIKLSYVLAAIAMTFVSYILRAVRWHYLLLHIKKASPKNLLSATLVGYMANNIFPARIGEFIRAYFLAKKEKIDTSSVFATLVVDRLWDGFTVLVILVITFLNIQLPSGMENIQSKMAKGGYAMLFLYLLVIIFLIFLKRYPMATIKFVGILLKPFPKIISEKIIPVLGSFITGIKFTTRPAEVIALAISSALIWTAAIIPVDFLLKAFGINLPFLASMFIMVFLVFAVMIPAAPGYIGTYHAACMYGLMAFNIPREQALSVAIVVHAVSFFPVIIAGFICLWLSKTSLSSLKTTSGYQE
ncbi:MAG: flippase-like domain-containing protein [Desulfuromonadales bacterium]|nr:flippase-like domain-containing protein [Desulfuromonadales bacterium]